jgi:hypothetical protein
MPGECPSQKVVADCEITTVGSETESIAASPFFNRQMLVSQLHNLAIN